MALGKRIVELDCLSHLARQETQARWGVDLDFRPARENGNYVGPVFCVEDTMLQRVTERTVVIHPLNGIDFTANEALARRLAENRWADVILQIRYNTASAKAFFHDADRAALEMNFGRIKKTASTLFSLPKLNDFLTDLELIRLALLADMRRMKSDRRQGD